MVNDAFYLVDAPGYGYAALNKTKQKKFGLMMEDYLTAIKTLLLQLKEEGSLVLTEDNSKKFFEPEKPGDTSTIVGQFISQTNQIVKLYEELEESIMDLYLYGNADSINEISDKFVNISNDLQSYKDGYLDDVNYYLAEDSITTGKYDFIRIHSNELYKIYDNLGNPYRLIDKLRLRKKLGE